MLLFSFLKKTNIFLKFARVYDIMYLCFFFEGRYENSLVVGNGDMSTVSLPHSKLRIEDRKMIEEKIEEKLETVADKEMIRKAFSLIKSGESICAREILDEILAEFPQCAEAYLGLLLLEVGVRCREELHNENTPFYNSINYKNALKYGDDKLEAFFKKIRKDYTTDGYTWVNGYNLQLHDAGAYYEVTGGVPDGYGIIRIPPYYKFKPIGAIAEGAFALSDKLNSIWLPATIRKIGERAFAGCSLRSIVLPDGLLEIGESAFDGCKNMSQMSFPINPLKICKNAFATTNNLERVNIKSLKAWCENVIDGEGASPFWVSDAVICINDEPVRELVIPEGVVEIKDNAFLNISSISSLKLPHSLRKIGAGAFGLASCIESVSFGDGVEEIGDYAFSGCERLGEVILPHTMKKIGARAFTLCEEMNKLSLGGTELIGDEAFSCCGALSSLTIPACVKVIGKEAFKRAHIKELKILGMPDLIDKGAFEWCEEIEDFSFMGAKVIGDNAFCGCKKIKSVIIPSGTEIIGNSAFYNCEAIEVIELPDTITDIGVHAFFLNFGPTRKLNINGLENWCNIKFGDETANPIYYSTEVFIDGKRIEKLIIPDSVSEIKDFAFVLSSSTPDKQIVVKKGARGIHAKAFVSYGKQKSKIFYEGTKDDFRSVITYGKKLVKCIVYYYSEKKPEKKTFFGGRQWRYVDGEPTPW